LTAADHSPQADELYSYDANGNRTSGGYSTGANNQLRFDGTYTYDYDGEGNRIRRKNVSTGAVTEYAWDHHNRLEPVSKPERFKLAPCRGLRYKAVERRPFDGQTTRSLCHGRTVGEDQTVYSKAQAVIEGWTSTGGRSSVFGRHLVGVAQRRSLA
jgi:hypothetical protein